MRALNVMRERMIQKIFDVSIAVLLVGFFVCIVLFEKSPNEAMQSLPLGSSYDDLVALAGKPSYITDGTEGPERGYELAKEQIVPGCVKEAWYENLLGFPSKYAFCFGSADNLLYKYHWSSW